MLSKQDLSKLYETVLATPGMQDVIKIDLRMERRQVLLLHQIIQRGIALKEEDTEAGIPRVEGNLEAIQKAASDLLTKAGLTEINEKLNSFL
jgi:hypothetical protein